MLFDDSGATGDGGEATTEESATRNGEDASASEFLQFDGGFRVGTGEYIYGVTKGFEGIFLSLDGGDNTAGKVEKTVGEDGDFHDFIIPLVDFLVKVCCMIWLIFKFILSIISIRSMRAVGLRGLRRGINNLKEQNGNKKEACQQNWH